MIEITRRLFLVLVSSLPLLAAVVYPSFASGFGAPSPQSDQGLERLLKSYPTFLLKRDQEFLHLRDGRKFKISDGRVDKTFTELLEDPDIDDMFFAPYPIGADLKPPAKNYDPGRVRFEPLFDAMYGDCNKGQVSKHLRPIRWLPNHSGSVVMITTINGVDKALQMVSDELDKLPSVLIKYLTPTAGTYNCRNIAGTRSKSMHAYGAAIDINTQFGHYWRWSNGWKNSYPKQIIDVFERHGFIWGGRWYHFDTMHFEYRPELLLKPINR